MSKKIKNALKEPKTIALIILGLIICIVGILIIAGIFGKNKDIIEKGQIQIQKGNRVITVNENGLVEYRSDDGVFYETWDPSRTSAFFASMEEAARRYIDNPPSKIPVNGYKITLWINGEIVTIYVSEDDEVVGEILEEIFQEFDGGDGGSGDLSDYFNQDDEEDGDEETGNYVNFPTPTLAFGVTATPTTVPGSSSGSKPAQTPPDCDLYGTLVTGRTVISNTICQVE